MATQLKLVGGTSTSTLLPSSWPDNIAGTMSGAVWLDQMLGSSATKKAKPSEDWQNVAEYVAQSQRVKEISKAMATFNVAATRWKEETKYLSSLTAILLHPSYQRIIGLGPDVVPFVLRDLADTGAHWFWALQALTGANPVPPEHEGRPRLMTQDWVNWGKQHDLL
jgi:hypothetical protein